MKKRLDWRDVVGWVLLLAITGLGLYLRFLDLDLKPMHHDEGVNAIFTKKLIEELDYKYNPAYYHGPLLYFLSAPFVILFGQNAIGMRVAPALLGALAIPAFVLIKDRITWLGVLVCALLMAVSPVEVYFSRTAIHEIYNGTFNLLLVMGMWRWWTYGERKSLYLAAASLACLFATKETTALTLAAMVPAVVATLYLSLPSVGFPGGIRVPSSLLAVAPARWRKDWGAESDEGGRDWPPKGAPRSLEVAADQLDVAVAHLRQAAQDVVEAYRVALAQADTARLAAPAPLPGFVRKAAEVEGGRTRRIPFVTFLWRFVVTLWRMDRTLTRSALIVFGVVMVALFSSFLTNPMGVLNFFAAFVAWADTGKEGKGHEKVWHYFIDKLLVPYYLPLLVAGIPGLVLGALRRNAFALFNLVWFIFVLAAYSAIPYKTPWCVISFSAPLFFGVGITTRYLVDGVSSLRIPMPTAATGVAVALLGAYPFMDYAKLSWKIQFEEYDVDGHPFIYVQNVREFMDLVADMRGMMKAAESAGIEPKVFMIKSRNPLRWYVVDMGEQGWANKYNEKDNDKIKNADIVITQRSQAKDVRKVLKLDDYEYREYHERPGQKFEMFIKKPLWNSYLSAVEAGEVDAPTKPMAKYSYSDVRTREMREAKKKADAE